MNLAGFILKLFGWKIDISTPDFPKCVICVAPHTSNWDFILGKIAYLSVGREAGFLMKESWFFPPLGHLLRSIGGIPVPKKKKSDLTEYLINRFNSQEKMCIAITPEGTRKRVDKWRKGFIYIAERADVPIVLAYIDYKRKVVALDKVFTPTGDIKEDLNAIKEYYSQFNARFPDKFSCAPE